MEPSVPETPPFGNRAVSADAAAPVSASPDKVKPEDHTPLPQQPAESAVAPAPTPVPAPAPSNGREMPRPRGTLQDYLALERTALANERTMLSYLRTALALEAAAFTLLKFFPGRGMEIMAYTLIPAGVICFTVGFMRFFECRSHLEKLSRDNNSPGPPSIS